MRPIILQLSVVLWALGTGNSAASASGGVFLTVGSLHSCVGGDLTLSAGDSGGTGPSVKGGSVTVATGSSATAPSQLIHGPVASGNAFDSGSLTLSTGNAYENSGGIYIRSGDSTNSACRATSTFK